MAVQRVAMVSIDLARLAELLRLPDGSKVRRVLSAWPLKVDGGDDTFTMVVEHPDLPEVPTGGLIPQAKPCWRWQPYREGPVFEDWGILQPEPKPEPDSDPIVEAFDVYGDLSGVSTFGLLRALAATCNELAIRKLAPTGIAE